MFVVSIKHKTLLWRFILEMLRPAVQLHRVTLCLAAQSTCRGTSMSVPDALPSLVLAPAACVQGVGVGLFRDRGCAVEACNKLSGAQADGRKLELVLMNSDNHVSFSCRQVGNPPALL